MASGHVCSITDLSPELLCSILEYLSLKEILAVGMLSKKLSMAVKLQLHLCRTIDFCEDSVYGYMSSSITDDHMHALFKKCPQLETVYGLHPMRVERRRLRKRSTLTVPGIIEALSLCQNLKAIETCDLRVLEAVMQHLPQLEIIGHFQNRDGVFPPHASQRLKLQPYPRISSLHLIGVEVPELTAMPHLQHLHLECVRFTKLQPFRAFLAQQLKSFVMKHCIGPPIALRYLSLIIALSSSPNLTHLELARVPLPGGLFQRAVEDSYKHNGFVKLKTLIISGCKGVLEVDLGHLMIVSSKNLETLHIQPSLTKDSLFVSLSFAQCAFPKLRNLHLGYIDKLNSSGLSTGEWSNEVLVSLGLAEIPDTPSSLTDSGMKVICQLFPAVSCMSVSNCPHLMYLHHWIPGRDVPTWPALSDLTLQRCHCLQLSSLVQFLPSLPRLQVIVLNDMFREPPKGCSHVGLSAGTGLGMSSAVVSNQDEHIAVQGHHQDLEHPGEEEIDENEFIDAEEDPEPHFLVLERDFFDNENELEQNAGGNEEPVNEGDNIAASNDVADNPSEQNNAAGSQLNESKYELRQTSKRLLRTKEENGKISSNQEPPAMEASKSDATSCKNVEGAETAEYDPCQPSTSKAGIHLNFDFSAENESKIVSNPKQENSVPVIKDSSEAENCSKDLFSPASLNKKTAVNTSDVTNQSQCEELEKSLKYKRKSNEPSPPKQKKIMCMSHSLKEENNNNAVASGSRNFAEVNINAESSRNLIAGHEIVNLKCKDETNIRKSESVKDCLSDNDDDVIECYEVKRIDSYNCEDKLDIRKKFLNARNAILNNQATSQNYFIPKFGRYIDVDKYNSAMDAAEEEKKKEKVREISCQNEVRESNSFSQKSKEINKNVNGVKCDNAPKDLECRTKDKCVKNESNSPIDLKRFEKCDNVSKTLSDIFCKYCKTLVDLKDGYCSVCAPSTSCTRKNDRTSVIESKNKAKFIKNNSDLDCKGLAASGKTIFVKRDTSPIQSEQHASTKEKELSPSVAPETSDSSKSFSLLDCKRCTSNGTVGTNTGNVQKRRERKMSPSSAMKYYKNSKKSDISKSENLVNAEDQEQSFSGPLTRGRKRIMSKTKPEIVIKKHKHPRNAVSNTFNDRNASTKSDAKTLRSAKSFPVSTEVKLGTDPKLSEFSAINSNSKSCVLPKVKTERLSPTPEKMLGISDNSPRKKTSERATSTVNRMHRKHCVSQRERKARAAPTVDKMLRKRYISPRVKTERLSQTFDKMPGNPSVSSRVKIERVSPTIDKMLGKSRGSPKEKPERITPTNDKMKMHRKPNIPPRIKRETVSPTFNKPGKSSFISKQGKSDASHRPVTRNLHRKMPYRMVSVGTQATTADIRRSIRRLRAAAYRARRSVKPLYIRRMKPSSGCVSHRQSHEKSSNAEPRTERHDKATSTSDPLLEDDPVQILQISSDTLFSFTVVNCGISSLVFQRCPFLFHVEIQACRILKRFQMYNCPSMKRINVSQCPKLEICALVPTLLTAPTHSSFLVSYEPCMQAYHPGYGEKAILLKANQKQSVVLCHDFSEVSNENVQGSVKEKWVEWLNYFSSLHMKLNFCRLKPKGKVIKSEEDRKPNYPWNHDVRRLHGQLFYSSPPFQGRYDILTNNPIVCDALATCKLDEEFPSVSQSECFKDSSVFSYEALDKYMHMQKRFVCFYIPINENN